MGSLRRECLEFLLILSERHLLLQVTEYVRYFNHARPHQGIAHSIPVPVAPPDQSQHEGEIVALPVLHGLHHDYRRRAA
jgi:hypothetical protein